MRCFQEDPRNGTAKEFPILYEPLLASLKARPNSNLHSLVLSDVPAPAIDQIVHRLPKLRSLTLLNCRPNLHVLFPACHELEKLSLAVCGGLDLRACAQFSFLRKLRELDLNCTKFEKQAVKPLMDSLRKVPLKSFRYEGESFKTTDVLRSRAFLNLETFSMSDHTELNLTVCSHSVHVAQRAFAQGMFDYSVQSL